MNTLFSLINKERQAIIDWQTELTKRPALAPENNGEGEFEKAAWLTQELTRLGVPYIENIPCPDARVASGIRPNILAKIPGKKQQFLWIIAHLDIVPPGDISLWHTDPYTVHVDGDYITGRGVEDNQQGIVSALLVAKTLMQTGITPEYGLGLLFVADEETGMEHGLPHVLETYPALICPDDMVVIPDIGNCDGSCIQIAEKNSLWLKFIVTGKQCHASTPQEGVNSLVTASACILALSALGQCFPAKNMLFTPPNSTFVPSKKENNVESINILPGKDVFYLDCRILPQYNPRVVIEICQEIANKVAATYGASINVEAVQLTNDAPPTNAQADVVTKLMQSLQKHRGITGVLNGSGGQTLASVIRSLNLPAVAWSTLIPNAHTPNERSSIQSTILDAQTLMSLLFSQS